MTTLDLHDVLDEAVTTDELAQYVGRRTFTPEDDKLAELTIDAACQLVARLLSDASGEYVDPFPPQATLRLAVLNVASELWERKSSRGGVMSFGPQGESTVRLSWDAVRAVRTMLAPYTVAV